MPNWCNNHIELYHDDHEMIQRAELALNTGRFFSEFLPCPKELSDTVSGGGWEGYEKELNEFRQRLNVKYFGFTDWYSWSNANWGTKWEACEPQASPINMNSLYATYDTAWSPPIAFYEKLQSLGFVVKAYYYEGGMAYCGSWDDGVEDYYNIEGNAEWVREHIPSEIDEAFCISESMAEWEDEADYTNQEQA